MAVITLLAYIYIAILTGLGFFMFIGMGDLMNTIACGTAFIVNMKSIFNLYKEETNHV